jgi:hypothetical protein
MSTQLQDVRTSFDWQPQPAAAELVSRLLDRCIRDNPNIAQLAQRMYDVTGTRLVDWVDSLGVAGEPDLGKDLLAAGFEVDTDSRRQNGYRHPEGIFPAVSLAPHGEISSLFVKVDSVDDFVAANQSWLGEMKTSGEPGSQLRQAWIVGEHAMQLHAVERHGWRSLAKPNNRAQQIAAAAKHRRALGERRREGASDAELFDQADALFDAAAADLGRDWACDLFFAAEREYWMSRNAAARVQYARQQKLGLGWGNHDHHTYRSSRDAFKSMIAAFENMGFQCRERFYAGREAGWGAQVIEQPVAGITIFADVDLTPDEVMGDFAHEPLESQTQLGTVGLWCRLHGEAFLSAGMHHLECQFDFDAVRQQLAAEDVETMTPFTNWAHLKQAFTKGEIFPVSFERIDAALASGVITQAQADQFRRDGALGSHLEILERNDGFKGFNQTGISEIIARTDPRKWAAEPATS